MLPNLPEVRFLVRLTFLRQRTTRKLSPQKKKTPTAFGEEKGEQWMMMTDDDGDR
jgi:hypothetical protein